VRYDHFSGRWASKGLSGKENEEFMSNSDD